MVEMVDNELKASSKPTGLDPNPIQNDETT
jgi:hypothetical protein